MRSIQLACLRLNRSPPRRGVPITLIVLWLFSWENGLRTLDTALFNLLGVLLKENALLTRLPILQLNITNIHHLLSQTIFYQVKLSSNWPCEVMITDYTCSSKRKENPSNDWNTALIKCICYSTQWTYLAALLNVLLPRTEVLICRSRPSTVAISPSYFTSKKKDKSMFIP